MVIDTFKRSWHITKLSFSVIWQDKELLLFPILSSIFSILFVIAMIFPTFVMEIIQTGSSFSMNMNIGSYVILFLVYLGLAFIATFFNVAVVYTTKKRFAGGNATFMESLKFAFSKTHLIFLWSIVAATVGTLLRIIEGFAQNTFGEKGVIVTKIITSIIGAAWAIVTLFVVPALVYQNLGPFSAIKQSINTVKKTWGESLIRHIGLGFAEMLFILGGLLILIPLTILSVFASVYLMIFMLFITVLYLIGVVLTFTVANTVFNTALYEYAQYGKVPGNFEKDVLENAFRKV